MNLSNWPQLVYIFMIAASLLISANKHGKDKTGKENFWTTLTAAAIVLTLLICGGFFKPLFQ